jgi:hypothetical protein
MVRLIRNDSVALTGGQADVISRQKDNEERISLVITNTNAAGGATCWLSNNAEAAANTGIQLSAGQSIAFTKEFNVPISQYQWTAYAAAGGTTLAVYEEIEA